MSVPSKGKNSAFSPCLTLIKPSTPCTHTTCSKKHRFHIRYPVAQMSPFTSWHICSCIHVLTIVISCHLCSEACSSVLQPSTLPKPIFRKDGCAVLYLEGETSALLVNAAGAVERIATFVVCCFFFFVRSSWAIAFDSRSLKDPPMRRAGKLLQVQDLTRLSGRKLSCLIGTHSSAYRVMNSDCSARCSADAAVQHRIRVKTSQVMK